MYVVTVAQVNEALKEHLPSGGRDPKLCREDRLLLTLMYWREYRTQLHIGQTYGLSEATVSRTIHAVEGALMRSGRLSWPSCGLPTAPQSLPGAGSSTTIPVLFTTSLPVITLRPEPPMAFSI